MKYRPLRSGKGSLYRVAKVSGDFPFIQGVLLDCDATVVYYEGDALRVFDVGENAAVI